VTYVILTAADISIMVLCGPLCRYQHFGGICYLHCHSSHTQQMERAGSSKILVSIYQTTRSHIPHNQNIKGKDHFRTRQRIEENNLYIYYCDNTLFDKLFPKDLFSVLFFYPYLSLFSGPFPWGFKINFVFNFCFSMPLTCLAPLNFLHLLYFFIYLLTYPLDLWSCRYIGLFYHRLPFFLLFVFCNHLFNFSSHKSFCTSSSL
jgi:hypothetical protein